MRKQQITFTLLPTDAERLRSLARAQDRSISKVAERSILATLSRAEHGETTITLAARDDAPERPR